MAIRLAFYGAAGEVTGSCHILTVGAQRILLDCGLIQGSRADEARNLDAFPFDAAGIDAVVLSHAHLDHAGRLPLLVQRGFRGRIHCQAATLDLCRILLRDAAALGERDAENENRRRARKGLRPVAPLYTQDDVDACLAQCVAHPYGTPFDVVPGIRARLHDAGHILGSTSVDLELTDAGRVRRLVFSGDLGQYDTPILHDPAALTQADLVIMESTYGGRRHRSREATVAEIGEIVSEAQHHRGNILIPAFAIGRAQEVLYLFGRYHREWDLDRWRIFLDSPMALEATEVYWNYPHLYDADATRLRRQSNEMPLLRNLVAARTADESRMINRIENGAIVIAGSGMCTGGRILHHLRHNVWRAQAHVLIVGYQAPGTLGRRLVDGAPHVRIFGETIRVNARIHTVGGLSAHGDENDLARWYSSFAQRPPVCLVHGEPQAGEALRDRLRRDFGCQVQLPRSGEEVEV